MPTQTVDRTSSDIVPPAGAKIRAVNECLNRGDLERANTLLHDLNESSDRTAQSLIVGGLTSLRLNRSGEARAQFERALDVEAGNTDALHNLTLLDISENDLCSAVSRLKMLKRLRPTDADIRNDLAVLWQAYGRPDRALVEYRRALRIDSNFSLARNNAMQLCLDRGWHQTARKLLDAAPAGVCSNVTKAEINRWREILGGSKIITDSPNQAGLRGKKIAFFASHDAFIRDFVSDLKSDNTVRSFDGDTIERMEELLRWADVAWFEWCDQLLIAATQLPKCCKIVCRLHSYEAFTDMPGQVDWSKVDHLVYVNRSVRELVGDRIPSTVPTSEIYNGVDTARFVIPADKPRTKKIGSVGYINYKKNPALLLYCFKKIHEYDPSYTLHIAGTHQDPRLQLYMTNFLKRHPLPVFFEGWVTDMPAWYWDKQFVISTSLFESFHYSVAEGMASGVLPLIHDWYGADYLYPQQYLYADPDSCLALVQKLEKCDLNAVRIGNRNFIEERYGLGTATKSVRQLLADVLQSTENVE